MNHRIHLFVAFVSAVLVCYSSAVNRADAANYTFQNVADTTGAYLLFGHRFDVNAGPKINNHGDVAFFGWTDAGSGIFSGPDATNDTLVAPDILVAQDMFASPSGGFSMNDRGEIVFVARDDPNDTVFSSVFIARPSGSIDIVADNSGRYRDFESPQINNNGDVAFLSFPDETREWGIFTGPDPSSDFIDVSAYVTVAGSWVGPGTISMNNNGTIAFSAILASSLEHGIFTGPDPITDTYAISSSVLFNLIFRYLSFYQKLG